MQYEKVYNPYQTTFECKPFTKKEKSNWSILTEENSTIQYRQRTKVKEAMKKQSHFALNIFLGKSPALYWETLIDNNKTKKPTKQCRCVQLTIYRKFQHRWEFGKFPLNTRGWRSWSQSISFVFCSRIRREGTQNKNRVAKHSQTNTSDLF